MEIGNNFYNYNVDYFSRAQEQKQTQVKEENREDDTRSLEKNEPSSLEKSENKEENKSNTELSVQEKIDLAELKARDTQVRAHEAAHQSGPAASGGATFTYQKVPMVLCMLWEEKFLYVFKRALHHKKLYQIYKV
ncbi:MAG: hypothetical protein ACNI3H_09355 [Halarcobacter ebronensis]